MRFLVGLLGDLPQKKGKNKKGKKGKKKEKKVPTIIYAFITSGIELQLFGGFRNQQRLVMSRKATGSNKNPGMSICSVVYVRLPDAFDCNLVSVVLRSDRSHIGSSASTLVTAR